MSPKPKRKNKSEKVSQTPIRPARKREPESEDPDEYPTEYVDEEFDEDEFGKDESDELPPILPMMTAQEIFKRKMSKILSEQNFATAEEANKFLEQYLNGSTKIDDILATLPSDPTEEALELALRAKSCDDPIEMITMLEEALTLDPDCIEALVGSAFLIAKSDDELISLLAEILDNERERLGSQYFEDGKGSFWGIVETRPFMRTLDDFAGVFLRSGRRREAIRCFEEMLELNPNDNQGARYRLVGLYFLEDDLERVRSLLGRYPRDFSPSFQWATVLERFKSGELDEASAAAQKAHAHNPYVKEYLTGAKRSPRWLPESYTLGSIEEAAVCFDEIGAAWKKNRKAIEWLRHWKSEPKRRKR